MLPAKTTMHERRGADTHPALAFYSPMMLDFNCQD